MNKDLQSTEKDPSKCPDCDDPIEEFGFHLHQVSVITDIICNPETRSDNNHYNECKTCQAVTTDEKVRLICVLFVKHYMKQRNRFHITEDLETKIKEIIEN